MKPTKLEPYKGYLDCAQVAEGINAANANARRLATDAQTLLDVGSHASAASLAALAIEESGKVSILRAIVLSDDENALKSEWKRYRSHTSKNCHWIFADLVAKGAKHLNDLLPIYDEASDHPKILDQLKQLGFYTDCLGAKAHWSIPADVIPAELAKALVTSAKIFSERSLMTEREVELWVEHMKPVWNKDLQGMKQALVSCYGAMQLEGFQGEGPNKMAEFVLGPS
ncbi:AbiV family abortive infection protein [Pseudomonas sp. W5-01]|uniref:AbiV family abortive infection protein n=1 Tax=Pseudomonas sp. W5-01 TaxID=3097454 RepID=UPI00397D3FDB